MANESIVFGSTSSPLSEITLGQLLAQQTKEKPNSTAVVFHWQKVRYTYAQLSERTNILAKAFLDAGLQKGDCVGVFAGNRWEYIEAFLAAARIGIIYVVLNSAYTPVELATAVKVSSCKLLFIANTIGPRDISEHIETVCGNVKNGPQLPELKRVVTLETYKSSSSTVEILNYNNFFLGGYSVFMNEVTLRRAEKKVGNNDILNLQFTSGTTGAPKAAELTHRNLINNGRLVGAKQKLTPDDVICCPPPLFHCFGLVMGFLAAMFHGCPIVFTSDVFNPDLVLDALVEERCTSLYGVPTMFVGVLEANERKKCDLRGIGRLRTGVAAGASVPMAIMKKISSIMGIDGMLIAYGMTETSPVTWMTSLNDTLEQRTSTVGTMMEHSGGKIIGKDGQILPRGERGELCTSGYALQRGYWRNPAKTAEAMKTDENGIRWMHTGDEGLIDKDGFCKITGRIKDMIIRGTFAGSRTPFPQCFIS